MTIREGPIRAALGPPLAEAAIVEGSQALFSRSTGRWRVIWPDEWLGGAIKDCPLWKGVKAWRQAFPNDDRGSTRGRTEMLEWVIQASRVLSLRVESVYYTIGVG